MKDCFRNYKFDCEKFKSRLEDVKELKQLFDITFNNAVSTGNLKEAKLLMHKLDLKIKLLKKDLSEWKIRKMKNTDAAKLKDASIYVRNWINHQPLVKEESITDWLLFEVSEKIAGVYYTPFSRQEESRKTGADWEWWFVTNQYSLKLRIQAKKLKVKSDNYPSIAYTNRYGLQIEKLLQDSTIENFIPMYAFYTSEADITMCGNNILDEGVYLSGGNTIYQQFIAKGKSQVTSSNILKLSNPLSCILGCPVTLKNGQLLNEFFRKYYPLDSKRKHDESENAKNNNEILGYYRDPPNYVTSFIQHSAEGLPDWWENEFRNDLENINALLVYDARCK